MKASSAELSLDVDMDGVQIRQAEFGDMNVAVERFAAGVDTEPIFKGLPDDRCQCPHWGYLLSGRLTVRYADREETISAGEVYYLPPGHTTRFDEDTEVVEFSPAGAYRETLEVAGRNAAALAAAQA